MFEIEDSDEFGSSPLTNRGKGGSNMNYGMPSGGKASKGNSLFGGASVYDDDEAYNFSAPVEKNKNVKTFHSGKKEVMTIPTFSPRQEDIPKKEVSALDKAQQMLQRYSSGPARTNSFTSGSASNKFKNGRADLSFDEDAEMSSEMEEEEDSEGPQSYGDLSISSPGLAKKKIMLGMQRAPSSSILPIASEILKEEKLNPPLQRDNNKIGSAGARKGMVLTNPEQSLEESIPEEEEEEEILEENEEDDENEDDDYGDDEFDETAADEEADTKNVNVNKNNNNHDEQESGSENENASYSRMVYGDEADDDEDEEEEEEGTLEESKPKILSFADLVVNAGWDPAAYEATKQPPKIESQLHETRRSSPEEEAPAPEESAEEYFFEPPSFDQSAQFASTTIPVPTTTKAIEVPPEMTTTSSVPTPSAAFLTVPEIKSTATVPNAAEIAAAPRANANSRPQAVVVTTSNKMTQPEAAGATAASKATSQSFVQSSLPKPQQSSAALSQVPYKTPNVSSVAQPAPVQPQPATNVQPSTDPVVAAEQQTHLPQSSYPYSQHSYQSFPQQFSPPSYSGYPPQSQPPMLGPPPHHHNLSQSFPPQMQGYYGAPPPFPYPYPYPPPYNAEGLYGAPPPAAPYPYSTWPYAPPPPPHPYYAAGPPPVPSRSFAQPPATMASSEASQMVIMDLLREFNKVKEEADWAKQKLAETVIMLQRQQHQPSENDAPTRSPPRSKDSPVIVSKPAQDEVDESTADYSEDFEISQIHQQYSALKAKEALKDEEDFELVDEKSPPKFSAEPAWAMPTSSSIPISHAPYSHSNLQPAQTSAPRYSQFSVNTGMHVQASDTVPAFNNRYSSALPLDPLADSIAKSILASQELLRAKLDSLRLKVQMSSSLDRGLRAMDVNEVANPDRNSRQSLSQIQNEFLMKRQEDSKRLYNIVRERFPDLTSEDIMSIAKNFS